MSGKKNNIPMSAVVKHSTPSVIRGLELHKGCSQGGRHSVRKGPAVGLGFSHSRDLREVMALDRNGRGREPWERGQRLGEVGAAWV